MDLNKIAEKIVDSKLTRDETIAYAKVLIREYARGYTNFCLVCQLPTDGEKCFYKRCPLN